MNRKLFVENLGRLSTDELFLQYEIREQWDAQELRRCKEPLESLGTVEHSAWEKEHNYGSTLVRLGLCLSQRVLFRHRRSVYATRTQGCRYREEVSQQFEPLSSAALAEWNPRLQLPDSRLLDLWAWAERVDSRWLMLNEQEGWRFSNSEKANRFASEQKDPGLRCYRLDQMLEQQGPGISLADFKLRMAPGPVFGYLD